MRLSIRLSETFGGEFESYNEVDHLLALRGYLLLVAHQIKQGQRTTDIQLVSNAISSVSDILEKDYSVDLARKPRSPRDLFEHYHNVVSRMWKWLRDLCNGA